MNSKTINIGNFSIKNFGEPFIIAEIGSNHNGKLELAKQLIDKAIECGADAVKFQSFDTTLFSEACYETDSRRGQLMQESAPLNLFFTAVHPELKREMQQYMTPKEMMRQIKEYCDTQGILFFCTPLDKAAVDFTVDELQMPIIKVASMDLNNLPFLDYLARKGRPIILSTGMGSFSEIVEAVNAITTAGNEQLIILHCIALYPTRDEIVNLNNIDLLRNNFPYPIGFSDNGCDGFTVPLAAIAKGAAVVEKHFTLDKKMPGWDHKISADPSEMSIIVREGKRTQRVMGNYQRSVTPEELEKRHLFRRSVVVVRDMKKGEVLRESDVDFRRPGTGIEPKLASFVVGRTLKNDVQNDHVLKFDDLA